MSLGRRKRSVVECQSAQGGEAVGMFRTGSENLVVEPAGQVRVAVAFGDLRQMELRLDEVGIELEALSKTYGSFLCPPDLVKVVPSRKMTVGASRVSSENLLQQTQTVFNIAAGKMGVARNKVYCSFAGSSARAF